MIRIAHYLAILVLLFLAGGCAPRPAAMVNDLQRRLAGHLSEDLSVAGDVVIEGDLRILPGVTLTILPGSSVTVVPSESTKIDPEYYSRLTEVLVEGTLVVLGEKSAPVRIGSRAPVDPTAEGGWAGIEVVGGRVKLGNLHLFDADTGILFVDGNGEVADVEISGSRYGIVLQGESAPALSRVSIRSGEAGLFCWDRAAPAVEDLLVVGNDEEGVVIGPNCQAVFGRGHLFENGVGLVTFQPSLVHGLLTAGNRDAEIIERDGQ